MARSTTMSCYFAHITAAGPIRYGQILGSIGVLEAPDQPMPIGMANCAGWNPDGLATWKLTVHGADVPGRWIIVDRKFRPVEEPPENPRPRC
jgi:hypothetical protein